MRLQLKLRSVSGRMKRTGAVAALLALVLVTTARADETTGTWTGNVELRGNYYWERSTRVLAPEFLATVASPGGVEVTGKYLVDSITSASQAAGLLADVRFTEVRHDFALGVSGEVEAGDLPLQLGLSAHMSLEPDYTSRSVTASSALSLNDRATVLSFNATFLHDSVGQVLRGANRVGPDGRDLSDRGDIGTLNAGVLSLAMTQALTPEMTIDVGYDLGLNFGFMSNAYRMVNVDGILKAEHHPDERIRHTLTARYAYYLDATRTSFHALMRVYADSWDVVAMTPELRVYQEIGDTLLARIRWRHYRQSESYFYSTTYAADAEYYTFDPKMSSFHSHLLGAQLVLRLRFLENTALDFAWNSTLDFSFDYIFNTNRFGDGIIGQVGLRLPF